ncbi:MAG: hypothetical protein U1E05_05900 [Patescibacteria group bacterium]|nr:hypothetical protein [Patescibacteria group bacterium]
MRIMVTSLGVALVLASTAAVQAADCCAAPMACTPAVEACDPGCGGPGVRKVCKVVVEMKKVKKHVWVCECEEHCTGLPGTGLFSRWLDGSGSCSDSAACEPACGGCGTCDPCDAVRAQLHCPPKCGPVRTRKKLVKKEVECEVPSYKCVAVSVPACRAGCCGGNEAANVPAVVTQDAMQSAPLPPVVGTSYLN